MNLEQSRNDFLKDLSKEVGLKVNKIKQILAEQEVTSYDPNKKASYRAIVLAYAQTYRRVEEKMNDSPKMDPCLMPGCKGKRQHVSKDTSWVCTIGGSRHYLAIWVAELTNQKPEDVLVTLTDIKEQATKRDETAQKLWLEEMNKRKKKEVSNDKNMD